MKPFRIAIGQDQHDDLHRRLEHKRLPELPDAGWKGGVPVEVMRELLTRRRTGYDRRTHEAALNRYPQFHTVIDGQPIHFVHVRSARPEGLTEAEQARLAAMEHNVVRWTEYDKDGHCFAMEQPDLFAADVREYFTGR